MESERKMENHEDLCNIKNDEIKTPYHTNGGQMIHPPDKANANPNKENSENNIRRHDEPSELSFEIGEWKTFCCCSLGSMISSIFLSLRCFSARKSRREGQATSNRRSIKGPKHNYRAMARVCQVRIWFNQW